MVASGAVCPTIAVTLVRASLRGALCARTEGDRRRAMLIPGMVGKNIGFWIQGNDLPSTVSRYGSSPQEIFVCYDELAEKYGSRMKEIPLGAVEIYSFAQKLRVGLQQLMAGTRNFRLSTVSRKDIMCLTEEAAKVSGIPYLMEAYRQEAEEVLSR